MRKFNPLNNEAGTILVMFAVCASLAVVLCIGIAIQKPTDDANATKLQHALSMAAANAIRGVSQPVSAISSAHRTAIDIMNNTYSTDQVGFFSPGVEDFFAWVPLVGPNEGETAGFDDFLVYHCDTNLCRHCESAGSCSDEEMMQKQLSIAREVFDLSDGSKQLDDHLNGIMLYATSQPFRYFSYLGTKRQEMAAAAVLNSHATYVLIDPAFSMEENYGHVFGQPGPKEYLERTVPFNDDQWPVRFSRHDKPHDVGGIWEYPADVGLYQTLPAKDESFTNFEVYRFYSSFCFNLAWDYYRGAAVDLIDYLSAHSAYANTSLVALTAAGPPEEHHTPVIPVYPVKTNSDPAELDLEFPVGSPLHAAQHQIFTGFIDTMNPARDANAGPDGIIGTADDSGSGVNHWELCMCRGLVNGEHADNSPYTYSGDTISRGTTISHAPTATLDHGPEAKRERSALAKNWCSDSTDPSDRNSVDLNLARHGLHNGESVRNIIAGLGIRVVDPKLERLHDVTAAENWTRGTAKENGPPIVPDDPMNTGWRYLPSSITSACDSIAAARTSYNADPLYGELRPLNEDSALLSVFAFGVWSPIVEEYYKSSSPAKDSDDMLEEFVEAIAHCICTHKIRVALAFLPLNDYDRNTVIAASNALDPLQELQNNSCAVDGTPVPDVPTSCLSASDPRLNLFIVDYMNDYFTNDGSLNRLIPSQEAQIKINAAQFFRENIPIAIRRLVTQFQFHI